MALEIERKFLLVGDDWKKEVVKNKVISQGYLTDSESINTVRIRVIENKAFITVKSQNTGLTRQEYEYPIPLADAKEMLKLCHNCIEKIRHYVPLDSHVFEIDEFLGDNKGLVIAEIELEEEGTLFTKPKWLGEEVSEDSRYFNSNLAAHPYNKWNTVQLK